MLMMCMILNVEIPPVVYHEIYSRALALYLEPVIIDVQRARFSNNNLSAIP